MRTDRLSMVSCGSRSDGSRPEEHGGRLADDEATAKQHAWS
jgi:hypothetical protein